MASGTRDRRRDEDLAPPASVALRNAMLLGAETLLAHRLRSGLTLLGIVIGVAAVVLVGASIRGLREVAVTTTARAFGSDTSLIAQVASLGNLSRKELAEKLRRNAEIYPREADSYAVAAREVVRVAPTAQASSDVKAGNRTFLAAAITGSSAGLEVIKGITVGHGRFFNDSEARRAQAVAVIGQDLVDELFPTVDPLGKTIRIQGRPFAVIGVQEKQGSTFGASQDRYVWIPLGAFGKIWGTRRTLTLFVQPRAGLDFETARDDARMRLRVLRRLGPAYADDFDILVPEAGRSFIARLTGMVSVAIVPISSVALFVAGIVVMNMMLVSVTERTREIGVRRSLGARSRDIYTQIVCEAAILTLAGGGAGIVVSWLGTLALGNAFGAPLTLPLGTLLGALLLSGAIGLGAGLYPAHLAARLPPVEALRAEG